jgi:hypothetical protein
LIITEEPNHPTRLFGPFDDPGQHECPRHSGLVDQDHRARRDFRLIEIELRQRVRVNAQFPRQHIGRDR